MAIRAGGQHVGLFFPELATDCLPVNLFDLRVALRTGSSDILAIDRRRRVGMRQDQVRRMATGAVGRYGESLFQQRLAVNALGVVLEDAVLRNVELELYRGAFAMASSAKEWDPKRGHR